MDMRRNFRMSLNQINGMPGDFKGNVEKLIHGIEKAKTLKSQLLVFPAQSITGMDYNSLFHKDHFRQTAKNFLINLSKELSGTPLKIIITCPASSYERKESVFLISRTQIMNLSGKTPVIADLDGQRIAVFQDEEDGDFHIKKSDCEPNTLLINFNTRPYYNRIQAERERAGAFTAIRTHNHFLEVNKVGTTDNLVYYGSSFLCNPNGSIVMRAKSFKEDFITIDLHAQNNNDCVYDIPEDTAAQYEAIVQSIRDYLQKNGFKRVLIGLSGGLDSALVTTLAVEALGSENVFALMMPSQFSSKGSLTDSKKLAKNLGIKTHEIPIINVYKSISREMEPFFGEREFNTTDENIQARVRGLYLMTISNEYSWVVLNTGNKSETATGYSTLYGDTIGGYAPISDLFKTDCYKLARFINTKKGYDHIPNEILQKPPSAELAPGQTDQDSLPPYDELDAILHFILEDNLSLDEIVSKGYAEEAVKKTLTLLRISEYKRRQEPLGPRLSRSSFTYDLNLPITNGFKEH